MPEKTKFQSTDIGGLLGRGLNDVEKKYAPKTLYYKGAMQLPIRHARVSIVGTRNPTETGISNAKKVAKALVKERVAIVSGLARGIDAVGHRTAIEEGGETIAVLGTPLNKTSPSQNTDLQKEIMDRHLAISQYPDGHTTRGKDFVLRNFTMALISDASVIAEAGDGGGTLHHGREALRLGRPLFICQSVFQNEELKWPGEFMRQGAVKLVDLEQIFEFTSPNVPPSDLRQHMS